MPAPVVITDVTGVPVANPQTNGWSKVNMTTGATLQVKATAGVLHGILIGTPVASATVKLYDGLTAVNIFSSMAIGSTITSDQPIFVGPLDIQFITGLTVVTSGATDVTVIYQ